MLMFSIVIINYLKYVQNKALDGWTEGVHFIGDTYFGRLKVVR